MKLRTDGKSLRLRLGQADLENLRQTKRVEVKLALPEGQSFTYSLLLTDAKADAQVLSLPHGLEIHLPKGEAIQWLEDEKLEGLYYTLPLNEGTNTRLLIEKDQPCLHKTKS